MFELDPAKSESNRAKHGIDFDEAQALWLDDGKVEIPSAQHHRGDDRQLVIGRLRDRCWVAIVTRRGDKVRIISVRRARDYEELAYEQANQHRA